MADLELRVEDFSFSFDCWEKDAEQAADIAKRLEIDVEGIEFWGNGRATVMVYGASMSDIRDLNKLLQVNKIEVL